MISKRVVVVGTSGSGKTTFARALAERLGIEHVELDALHWGPNWTKSPRAQFRERVEGTVARDAWVCDGNYSSIRDLLWTRATDLVWLNYSFPVVYWRAVSRTFKRLVTQEELYSGNRETLRNALDPEWIPWWVIRTYRRRRREVPRILREPRYSHLVVHEFRTSSEADAYLAEEGS